jgi:hypothetical protein
VGGVSERPTRVDGESDLFSATRGCNDGERHPVLQDGGTLRGVPKEWRARSVRHVGRSSTLVDGRTGDMGMSSGKHPRRGTKRQRAHSKALAPDERGMICLSLRGTRPSLGPEARARKSALNLLGDTPRGCRVRNSIAVGQTRESGKNRHRDCGESDECTARHSSPPPQGGGRDEKEKEDGRGHRPCEETRALVWLLACR